MVESLMTRMLRWIGAVELARDAPEEALQQALCELERKQCELQTELGRAAVRRHLAQKRNERVSRPAAPGLGQLRHTRALEDELALARQKERECERYLLALSEQIATMQGELESHSTTPALGARTLPSKKCRCSPSSER